MERVLVCGGGLAGLAATVALSTRGCQVTLLETRQRLGGRASSYRDAATGETIDNCQHVSMGCCTNYQHFCRETGLEQYFTRQDELLFVPRQGPINRFSASAGVPAPLHLAPAFASLTYLSWSEKLALGWGVRQLARVRPTESDHRSMADWLREVQQPPAVIERFWTVVLVSALSETLDRIDIGSARKVLRDGFLCHPDAWTVEIPTVPLDDLYSGPLQDWLKRHHVDVQLGASVERLVSDDEGICHVMLRGGQSLETRSVVCALPFYRVAEVLPAEVAEPLRLQGALNLQAAPISSLHFWFEEALELPAHAVLLERLSQWMFNRTAIARQTKFQTGVSPAEPSGGTRLQVVISASREVREADSAQVLQQVLHELGEIWPQIGTATLKHWRLITEPRAVFSPLPGHRLQRPATITPVRGLYLAGDWVDTGWPATMEGAVRSGYRAAEEALQQLGRPAAIMQPELPESWLFRLLYGSRARDSTIH